MVSSNTHSASRNCSVGLRYIRKPTVESVSRRAAPAKASSGRVVTTPLTIINAVVFDVSPK